MGSNEGCGDLDCIQRKQNMQTEINSLRSEKDVLREAWIGTETLRSKAIESAHEMRRERDKANEIIRADGPRMANAEHRLDQAYDAISSMLWLQYQHWPLTLEQKKELLPEIMHVTFTRVEEWKAKQTEAVKYGA